MRKLIAGLMALAVGALSAGAVDVKEVPTANVPGPAMVTVGLPAAYETDTISYPVVYLLNGHGGDNMSWHSRIADIDSLATTYGCVIVCPAGQNSWYWDSPVDSTMQMESYVMKDLIPWVESHYRTRRDRGGRAITGLSMGGHGGLWLGLRHTDVFGAAGSTSGGVDIRPFPERWNMADRLGAMADNPERWDRYTVMELVDGVEPGRTALIFDCGTDDFFYDVNNRLHRELTARGVPHTYLTGPGGHTNEYWARSIGPQLQFFHTYFYCK